jgi:hypothetical protein
MESFRGGGALRAVIPVSVPRVLDVVGDKHDEVSSLPLLVVVANAKSSSISGRIKVSPSHADGSRVASRQLTGATQEWLDTLILLTGRK